jgi:serine/threonine protein kinase
VADPIQIRANPKRPSRRKAPQDKLTSPGHLSEGQRITSEATGNTYTVGYFINSGNFGDVYACTDVWENNLVIKVLKQNNKGDTHDRALHEMQALLHVRHQNVVPIQDAFSLHGLPCIVSLRCSETVEWLKQRPDFVPGIWFRPLANCLLQALNFTHVQTLAHCDIHDRNVFVHFAQDQVSGIESATTFMLGDYGLARPIASMTGDGTFLNCIKPPEAICPTEFGRLDHRADIYQAGLLLLGFLKPDLLPFDQMQLMHGVPQDCALSIGGPLGEAIAKMLRRHVDYRTQNAIAAWEDIRDALLTN